MNPISTYRPFGQPASGTVKVISVPAAGKTVSVAGVAYTYGTHFFGRHIYEIARSLAATINADRGEIDLTANRVAIKSTYAFVLGDTVVIIATVPGTDGNSIALATSDSGSFTVSAAALAGGTDAAPDVTVASGSVTTTPGTPTGAPATQTNITIAVAGTRQQLASAVATLGVIIYADPDNAGYINVGDVTVTSKAGTKRGMILTPAGSTPLIAVSNANKLYINGDGVGDVAAITVL